MALKVKPAIPPTLEQQLAQLEAVADKAKSAFAAQAEAAKKATAKINQAFAGLAPLLAEPEVEPEVVPAGLEPPAPVAEVAATRPQAAAVGLGVPGAARTPRDRQNGSQELAEAWAEADHPRWPKGTPGGLGGQFMRAGQRFKWKGEWFDVDQVLPGGVYAHVATRGKHGKAAYVWIPSKPKKTAEGVVQEIPEVERPPAEVVVGAKGKTMPGLTQTVIDPYVQHDHDPAIPVPPEAPPEMTPERWQRFGRADQMRYTDLMKQFGKWSPGKAQGLVDTALAKQSQDAVSFVLSSYSSQYGSSSGFTIGLVSKFKQFLPGGAEKAQAALEKTFREYEEAKAVQDAAARAIQWDLYNRTKSPDISIFHKSGDSSSWWKSSIISGEGPIFSGLSQTQHYKVGGFGHVAVCSPVAIRNIVLATTSADIYKGHSFHGEQEVSLRDPANLDERSLVFDDGAIGNASSWLGKVTAKGADGTVIEQLKAYMAGDLTTLPIPPEPPNITTLGAGGAQTWTPPPAETVVGIGKLKYAHVDANGAPLPKPASTLELKPGDYIEGMQGTRYIIVEDKGDPFGIRYYKATDGGAEQPDGSFTGHEDFKGEECYTFEGQGVKPFKKLEGHAELPSQAKEAKTGFVAQAWSETAPDSAKFVSQLEPGTKFTVHGIPYQIEAQLPGGQVKIENLDTGGLAQINGTYKTPWLVLKAGYTEQGVPVFQPEDYFVHAAGPLGEAALKEDDLFYAGATGDKVWRVVGPPGADGAWPVQGVSAGIEGKADSIGPDQTGRKLEPKPVGWLPPAVGDTLAIDGKKGEVTKLLAGGVVQVNLKPGVVKLKPGDARLAGLFRPEAHQVGEKMKLRDLGVGEKFHGGSGERVRPYLVVEKDIPRGKGKPKGVRVRNLDTGEESVMPGTRSYARLNPKGTDQPEPGAPESTPIDHGVVFDPNAWKVGGWLPTAELLVGDKVKGGTTYYEVTADKGAAWEWKDLLTGEHLAVTKSATEVEKLEPSGVVPVTGFDPDAYNVGAPKKLSELKKGDIFQGTKKGKHYVVKTTGAKSGLSAMDLETGKVSSPWSYEKVAPVLEPKGPAVEHQGLLDGDLVTLDKLHAGDQFLSKGQLLEVVEPTSSESDNVVAAPVAEGGGLGFPSKVGHYPGLLVTYHEKPPPPPPDAPALGIVSDPENMPTFAVDAFSPKSKTGGGYVFTKAKNAAPGTVLKDKDGKLYKVVQAGADPVVSNGDAHGVLHGELNLKVVDEPFVDNAAPGVGPEVAPPATTGQVGPGAPGALPALKAAVAAKGPSDWADNTVVKLELDGLKPGDVWRATATSTPYVALGPMPGNDDLVYSQNLETGAIEAHTGAGVPDMVAPAMAPLFEPAHFAGWGLAGEKSMGQLEPGDYYSSQFGPEPGIQVLDNKGDALVVRAVSQSALDELEGEPGGKGEPYEIQNPGGVVAVYEPIPKTGAKVLYPPPEKVGTGSLPVGAKFHAGATHGAPEGDYEVIAWSSMPETAAAAKGKYGVPPGLSVTAVVWARNTETGDIVWFGDGLAVTPLAAAAPSAEPGDYYEVGKATVGDLEPGDFFKSAKGVVWQVGQPGESVSGAQTVEVTGLQAGTKTQASPSMPVVHLVPKTAGVSPELPGTHDPDAWEFAGDVPAHTLSPGDVFSYQGKHFVVNEGHPPEALGDKYAADPDYGWVTNLADGKSVAYKNTPGGQGDNLLSLLKPKAQAEFGVPIAAKDWGPEVGDEFLKNGQTWTVTHVGLGGPGTFHAIPEFGGIDDQKSFAGFDSVTPVGKGGGRPFGIGDTVTWTTDEGVKTGEVIGFETGKPQNVKVQAPGESGFYVVTASKLEKVPAGPEPDFGPPPPQEDVVPNTADLTLADLGPGDRIVLNDIPYEVVEQKGEMVTVRDLATDEMFDFPGDSEPDQVPAYKLPPPGGTEWWDHLAFLEGLGQDVAAKGPLPDNASKTQLSALPAGSLVQMLPEDIASGPSDKAVWRVVGPVPGGIEVEIVVPALGGYKPGHKHVFGPDQVFDRALTPQAKKIADALDTSYIVAGGPGAPLGSDGQPLLENTAQVKLGEMLPGHEFTDAVGNVYTITSISPSPSPAGVTIQADPVHPGKGTPGLHLDPSWEPEFYGTGSAQAPPAAPGPIAVPPNVAETPVGQLPVGTLVQEEPLASEPGSKPAVWRVTGHSGGLVQMEVVEPSTGGEAPFPVGHALDFDPDKVFPRALYPAPPAFPAEGPGAGTVGALAPGDHFLKAGVVYQVDGPAPGLEGSHVRAHESDDPEMVVDYPVGTNVVKVPPPGAGPEVAAPGAPAAGAWAQASPPAVIDPFPKLKPSELVGAKEPVADMPIGVRFKLAKGADSTYRVVGRGAQGEILVVTDAQLEPFGLAKPDASGYRADEPTTDDLPPTKDWADFNLGEEAWTLGGKHGHFESPESGPAQYEKTFLIDGDPTPHQFTGQLYIADPLGGPPGAGPEVAAPTGKQTVADLEVGDFFTMPEQGYGKVWKKTSDEKIESVDGEMTTMLYDLSPALTNKVEIVRPPGAELPDHLPPNAAKVKAKDMVGWLVQAEPTAHTPQPAIWRVTGGPDGEVEIVKDGFDADGKPQDNAIGHKQEFGASMAWPRAVGPEALEPGGYLGPEPGPPPTLSGGEPGDKIELGGNTYTIVADAGDGYEVENEAGDPAGVISKWNEQAKLVEKKGEADVKAGKGKLSKKDVLKPYSPKSKTGGGYYFSDLDDMAIGAEFADKTGAVYVVAGKSTDGYYVRFYEKGKPATRYQAPAGARVKLVK